jgi:signal transduction histidine kinase
MPAAHSVPPLAADLSSHHPLEILPFFRRFRPGPARDLLYTLLWNCALGAGFWGLAILFGGAANATAQSLGWNLIVANVIGYMLHALFVAGAALGIEKRVRTRGSVAIAVYYTVIPTFGVVAGFALVTAFLGERQFVNFLRDPRWIGVMAGSSLVISALLAGVFFARERQARVEAALERERARAERVEREAALATLRALQAQIEPHFLFNTLANVASLIDSDPALSKRMLERFIRFLRASLAATREETTTLGAEGELIDAYLDVMEVRMGSRMRHEVRIEPALAGLRVPPMLLQPLVENAIRHGLEPRVEGGEVRVSARPDGDHAVLEVRDTGVGFAPTTRGGTGLANVRDRLGLIYAGRASLEVTENPGGGTVVSLRIPA